MIAASDVFAVVWRAVLIIAAPPVVVLALQWLARRAARRHDTAVRGEPLGSESAAWRWLDRRRVLQTRHQGGALAWAGLAALLGGSAATGVLMATGASLPGLDWVMAFFHVPAAEAARSLVALLWSASALSVLGLLVVLVVRVAWGPYWAVVPWEGNAPGARLFEASAGQRALGYLDHHRLVEATRVLLPLMWVIALLVVAVAGLLTPAPQLMAPALSGTLLLVFFTAVQFAMGAQPCWRSAPSRAPVEAPDRPHILDILRELGWEVPAPGDQAILADSTFDEPAEGELGRILPPFFAELEIRIPHNEQPIAEVGWAHAFLQDVLRDARPQLMVAEAEPRTVPVPFSATRQGANPPRSVRVVHGPAGCGKATAVRWLALHNAIYSMPPPAAGSGAPQRDRRKALVLVPTCRGDEPRLRRSAAQEMQALRLPLEALGALGSESVLESPDCVRVGSRLESADIAVTHLAGLVELLATGDRSLVDVSLVAVLDLDIYDDLERGQLREALRALNAVLLTYESPECPVIWVGTSALPSLENREWLDDVFPARVHHIDPVASDLRAKHALPLARDLDLVLLPECRTADGHTARLYDDLLEVTASREVPTCVYQRDAWWPTIRRHPVELHDESRWPQRVDRHHDAHVIVIRDNLLPACRRLLGILNANLEGDYQRSRAVVFIDCAPFELPAVRAMLTEAALQPFGVISDEGRLPEMTGSVGRRLAAILPRCQRWPLEVVDRLERAHERWADVLLSRWSLSHDAFAVHWREDLYARACRVTAGGGGDPADAPPDAAYRLVLDEARYRWRPLRYVARGDAYQVPPLAVDTATLAPLDESVQVHDRERDEPRFRADPSTYLFQAYPGAVWSHTSGASAVSWRRPRSGADGAPEVVGDFGETTVGAGVDFTLPLRVVEHCGFRPIRAATQAYAGRAAHQVVLGGIHVRIRPLGARYFDDAGREVSVRVHELGELDRSLPFAARFDTEALLVYERDEPMDEATARQAAARLYAALILVEPVSAVLCHVDGVPLTELSAEFESANGWGILLVDGCDGGLGLAHALSTNFAELGMLMTMGGVQGELPGFVAPTRAVPGTSYRRMEVR